MNWDESSAAEVYVAFEVRTDRCADRLTKMS